MQKKKRMLLLRREMERARAGGGDGQGGFLRRLVNSVVRPGQSRTPAESILSLQAEVGCHCLESPSYQGSACPPCLLHRASDCCAAQA